MSSTILNNITKNKDNISLDDLMQFEKAVSEMDAEDKKFWKSQISSIESRMKSYANANLSKNKDINGDNEVNIEDLRSFWETTYGAE